MKKANMSGKGSSTIVQQSTNTTTI